MGDDCKKKQPKTCQNGKYRLNICFLFLFMLWLSCKAYVIKFRVMGGVMVSMSAFLACHQC